MSSFVAKEATGDAQMDGSQAERWLELPVWMFDRAACPPEFPSGLSAAITGYRLSW
jgi:hypothetical protein